MHKLSQSAEVFAILSEKVHTSVLLLFPEAAPGAREAARHVFAATDTKFDAQQGQAAKI